jgi:hypothetical protein
MFQRKQRIVVVMVTVMTQFWRYRHPSLAVEQ